MYAVSMVNMLRMQCLDDENEWLMPCTLDALVIM